MEGLMGVMGDTDGCIGDRLVGEATVRLDRLRERDVEERWSTMVGSFWLDGW